MAELTLYEDEIAEIAARLDLRDPNREALSTINAAVSEYFDVEERQSPFEAVVDSATGVGKTYILAGAMELSQVPMASGILSSSHLAGRFSKRPGITSLLVTRKAFLGR